MLARVGCPVSAHSLARLVVRPLDAALKVTAAHIGALSLPKSVVHETVAKANGLLGLCEHHLCDCAWVSRWCCWWQSCACEGWVEWSEICPAMSFTAPLYFLHAHRGSFVSVRSPNFHAPPLSFLLIFTSQPEIAQHASPQVHVSRSNEHIRFSAGSTPLTRTQRQEDRHQLPPRPPRPE